MSLARKNGNGSNRNPEDEFNAYKKEIGKQYMDGLISDKEYESMLDSKKTELSLDSNNTTSQKKSGGPECPMCGALVNPQDTECGICGSELTPAMSVIEPEGKRIEEIPPKTVKINVPGNWRKEWLDKAFRNMPPEDLLKQPPDALKGVSKDDSNRMKDAFNIKTMKDFATNKYLIWAQELVALKKEPGAYRKEDYEHKVIKEYESKGFDEILKSPTFALQGVSEADAKKLTKAFNTKTIEELGSLKFITWARGIYQMAPPRVFKVGEKVLLPSGQIGKVASVTEPDSNGMQKIEVAVSQ